ncbi:S46 family peptidase [Mesoterricola silvestris]|uniref:Dipeptidyl-peptidase n=1 Tax=Mesoterricola silvestris TaxID=2927979 RepID=A0AA48GPM6_9BACT|nr:S46 family peptidase [Mesoterricola silvestris]BDU71850.1 dipeptidyl-peptidase [Mesoterricola silvestris]
MKTRSLLLPLAAILACAPGLRADEGMWTFDNLPVQKLKADYNFTPDQAWLDHVRLSSLRFPGGSGSFISADGLVLTNHHVGRGSVQQLSSKEHDYIRDGFIAATRGEELKVPGLELYTLMAMENVTDRVNKAVKPGSDDKEALKARKDELGKITKEIQDRTGLTAEAVTLYAGGEYWMYQYKKHTDVRLVMAPEQQIAFFGGDSDNFTYPRHNLDFTLFRVYEDGKPYHPAHHLNWTKTGVKNGDLTFVVGHPGSTERLGTSAQMAFAGGFSLPMRIKGMERQRQALLDYAKLSPENKRQVGSTIFGLENGIKAMNGYLAGLKDQEAMARIAKAEATLKAKVAADRDSDAAGSWDAIEKALEVQKALFQESQALNARSGAAYESALLGHALTLVRLAEESAKPSDQRLEEYRDTRLEGVRKRLLVNRPFYPALETAMFTFGLTESAGTPLVASILGGRTPAEFAKAAVDGSRLNDPAVRKALVEGGKKAIDASQDPMIVLARKIDGPNREFRRKLEDQVTSVLAEHGGRIAKARFKAYGKSVYPDATFTLRMTYGPVASYPANGTHIQPFTTLGGLYDRAAAWGPEAENGAWSLPKRWIENRSKVNPDTPFVFAHAVDIIGGNSGSPVIDRKGDLIGLIFDGNIESLPGHFFYDGKVNRGIAVDARAILESLDKVYADKPIVHEILGK